MANENNAKIAEEIRRPGQVYQEKEQATLKAEEEMREFVFKVMTELRMWKDMEAIRDMTCRVPPSYARFILFENLHELEKQSETDHVSASGTIDEETAAKIQRLGQVYREKEKEDREADSKLREVVFRAIDEQKIWDDIDAIKEMSYRLPTCLTWDEVLSRYVELKRLRKADG